MLSQAREVGEKEKESARGMMGRDGSCPARFVFFFIIAIFIGIPSGNLGGGESPLCLNHRLTTRVLFNRE